MLLLSPHGGVHGVSQDNHCYSRHTNYLIKYTTYTLAFARITPGSNGSELFIRISALTANPCADSP